MPRPGVNIITRESQPPSNVPTDVGVGFLVGVTEKGPLIPVPVYNMTDYEATYGTRQSYAITAYDSAEFFFKEGGYKLYVARVVGPAAATAQINLTDNVAAVTLVAKAKGPGDYGNDLNVVVRTNAQDASIPAGYWRARVQTDAAVILEESYDLLDDQAGILWGNTVSKYIVFTDGASALDPAAATYSLAGGVLDSASIVDAQWQAALDRITPDMGPGQVFAPGRVTTAGQLQLANHALANNRIAILDAPDTAVVATLTALPAALIDTSGKRSRFSGMFGPWLYVPGLTVGTQRLVPPSALVAGVMARNDSQGMSPNEPAAGSRGVFRTVLDVSQSWDGTSRQTLNAGGVNVIRNTFGTRKIYGYRTTADPTSDSRWINLGNSRLHRAIGAEANAVGERFVFRQIDGQFRMINEFGAALIGEACMPFYLAGSLYGDTPDDAFKVDVGPSINTPSTISNNELHAVITARMSPFGEEVDIDIVKLLITEEVV